MRRPLRTIGFAGLLLWAGISLFGRPPVPLADARMSPVDAAAGIGLPAGFRATLFAGEPAVHQPIAMATDARGRLWVAENYSYSERAVGWDHARRDRILIFEDTDHDGRFDRRTVFWDNARRLTSIELGLGGVWAICLPELIFVPDRDGDDVPDGPPEVRLDGFEYLKARHTVANGLRWGPDGWLYGRQGILARSLVGAPGAPASDRTALNVGIWRYHPHRRIFERVADGTTNPWGMDWDAEGELFFINTVIGHLWHAIPGAHFRRMSGDDPDPYVYEAIEQHADHVHWATGEVWTDVRRSVTGATLAAGGGHAHTGLLIYQGGQWPTPWNDKLLTVNFHGRRLNVTRFDSVGSARIGRREPDAFMFSDPRFRGIDLLAAPDGGVFVSDWNDQGECHNHDAIDRSDGRIFKINYGPPTPPVLPNFATLPAVELARLQLASNDWLARQSRRALADRAAAGLDLADAHRELRRILAAETAGPARVRALWALHVSGANPPALFANPDPVLRVWSIRLATEARPADLPPATLQELVRLAHEDPSARVRLALASSLQRLPPPSASAVASALLTRAEDAEDHNLPLMLWYGIAPLATAPGVPFESLLTTARIPRVSRLGARRLAEDIDSAPQRIETLLSAAADAPISVRAAVLDGLAQGLTARRRAPKPAVWDPLQSRLANGADAAVKNRLRDLGALFGDGRALEEIQAVALDSTADLPRRRAALEALIEARAPGLRGLATALLRVRGLSAPAAAGLALFDDPAIAATILDEWPDLLGLERPAVMGALVSRPQWSAQVLDALAAGRLRRSEISVNHARQIRAYHDPELNRRLDTLWGRSEAESAHDPSAALAPWLARFTPGKLAGAQLQNGRAVYRNLCAACHRLNGEGGVLGPDLSGSARDNLGYLLDNLLFPGAIVADDFRLTTLSLKDGRTLAGMVRSRATRTLKLQTMTELIALSVDEIVKEETSAASLMPPGLLDGLSTEDARDLIAYLMAK